MGTFKYHLHADGVLDPSLCQLCGSHAWLMPWCMFAYAQVTAGLRYFRIQLYYNYALFTSITSVVNMMYLKIIYQCKALQVLKAIKQKGFQLACKQAKYEFTKVSHIAIPIEGNAVLTNQRQLLLYISYEHSDLYMLVTSKNFFLRQSQG